VSGQEVLVLNGPNLNLLGVREPDVYGNADYQALVTYCEQAAKDLGLVALVRQTNSESELVEWVQEAAVAKQAIVINPAAFTHYSYALRDALAACTAPVVEVHVSNPAARESFRHQSVVSAVVTGSISGFGFTSYELALRAIKGLLDGN
jgi:3-dehydroquinate dehydratase-2